jgi:hypothetical protein
MIFKDLKCLLPSLDGGPCGKHLADVEACACVTMRFTCPSRRPHGIDTNKIEFTQDEYGTVRWRPIPLYEKKAYEDDCVRIGSAMGDDVP